MNQKESAFGKIVLCVNHMVGFIDLVATPIWIGVLVQHFKNNPQQAGGAVSLFLFGQVLACIIISPKYDDIKNRRLLAAIGFFVGALGMFMVYHTEAYAMIAVLHLIAGITVGTGLSLTHGTVGRSENPHRLFAMCSLSLGILGILFFLSLNPLMIRLGRPELFFPGIAVLILIAAILTAIAFPSFTATASMQHYENQRQERGGDHAPLSSHVWFAIAGLMCMAMVTAMASAFIERLGIASGYSPGHINTYFFVLGFLLLLPPIFAALLQNCLKVRTAAMGGIIFQAIIVYFLYTSNNFTQYVLSGWGIGFASIFTHTFIFGYLARMDPSGRAVAANPAIIMTGSMLGPFLGGTIVTYFGYPAIAYFVAVWDILILLICFRRLTEPSTTVAESRIAAA